MHVVVLPLPYKVLIKKTQKKEEKAVPPLYLQTNSHYYVWRTLLWLIGFYTWIHQLNQLIKYNLVQTMKITGCQPWKAHFTFWTIFLRFESRVLSELLSKAAFAFAFTFCRNKDTYLTLTSDSRRAEHISLSMTSRSYEAVNRRNIIIVVIAYFIINNWSRIEL